MKASLAKSLDDLLFKERLTLLYRHLLLSIPANLICAVIVFLGLIHVVPKILLYSWFGSVLFLSLLRLALRQSYFKNIAKINTHYLTAFAITAYLSAFTWGIAGSILMPVNVLLQTLILVVIAGVTAGSLQTLRPSFMIAFGYIILSLVPLITWLLLQQRYLYFLISVSVFAYLLFLIGIAWQAYRLTVDTLKLRFHNVDLLEKQQETTEELKKINLSLQESKNQFQSAFDFAAIGMALTTLKGNLIKTNQSLSEITGYAKEELSTMNINTIVYENDIDKDEKQIHEMLNNEIENYQIEKRLIKKNKELCWVLINTALIKNIENQPIAFILQIQDIHAQKKAEDLMSYIAYHDPLTNLGNRMLLIKKIRAAVLENRNQQFKFALLLLDIDRFKHINDSLGHHIGDQVLKVIANRLLSSVRATDSVIRLGGDEFCVILTKLEDIGTVSHVANKILEKIAQLIYIEHYYIAVTVSLGASIYPDDGKRIRTLFQKADLALYQAKEKGNYFQLFESHLYSKHLKEPTKKSLNKALLDNEFQIYYQPIIDLKTQKIVALESLLRWSKDETNTVDTEEVIQLAIREGIIHDLTKWTLQTVINQVMSWQSAEHMPCRICINFSANEFYHVNFVDTVHELLTTYKLPLYSLEFEINENVMMQVPERNMHILDVLRQLGISLSIDNFGMGLVSLDYLQRLRASHLKINRALIGKIDGHEKQQSIVEAIIQMSASLGMKTVAVGIETRAQYQFLAEHHCQEGQGYFIAKPMKATDIPFFIKKNSLLIS